MSAVRSRMIMLAHVERDMVAQASDAWNASPPPDYQSHGDPIPCYAWAVIGAGTDKRADDGKKAALEEFKMMTPLGADITVLDRISKITNRRDEELFAGPLTIDARQRMDTHLEFQLGRGRPV